MENQTHILNAIKYLDERMTKVDEKELEKHRGEIKDILQSQAMLDEIIVKSSDDILAMKKTKEENADAIQMLDAKLDKINEVLKMTKKEIKDKEEKKEIRLESKNYPKEIKCKLCETTFRRFSDLEIHIRLSHENHHVFKCDQCDKCFVLNWRLKKHMKLHTEEFVKHCYYFNNNINCPFEEIGCKFLHAEAKSCGFGSKCNKRLCPLRHHEEDNVQSDVNSSKVEKHEGVKESDMSSEEFQSDDSFLTSTPNKIKYECEECINKTQCTDCFVNQHEATGQISHGGPKKKRRVHF